MAKKRSYYFPIDCPWPSKESDVIKAEAEAKYKEMVDAGTPYVALVSSSHPYSQGYWVEQEEPDLSIFDRIVKCNKKMIS